MKCKEVQECLPLYVGGDLHAKSAQEMTAHVRSCAECSTSANEYRESYRLTQGFTLPTFSEEIYDEIRHNVLQKIAQQTAKPKTWALPRFIPDLIRLRPGWALATVMFAAISLLALYFVRNSDDKRSAGNSIDPPKHATQTSPSTHTAVPPVSPGPSGKEPDKALVVGNGMAGRNLKRPSRNVGVGHREGVFTKLAIPPFAELNSSEPLAVSTPATTTSEKPLRVEMQTNDRNIRIIWFTYQNSKQDSPGKSSKGI